MKLPLGEIIDIKMCVIFSLLIKIREDSLSLAWGRHSPEGGEKFSTVHEGGAKIFQHPAKGGGQKI